jgi:hypothetical protein
MAIPKTLHQLWKTADVPMRFTMLRESWRKRNPQWAIRLWTDVDLDELVASRYPSLLPLFRSYHEPICRADLGRYLVLESFGGVYADLDCECLKPLDPLLAGRELVIGLEPEDHLADAVVVDSGLARLVCPTFIASALGHPFWAHVRRHVAAAVAGPPGPLNLTGTFLLTRAYETYAERGSVALLASPLLYPFTKTECWAGNTFELDVWERRSREAYAAHFWDGGWFRQATPLDGLPWNLSSRLVDGQAAAYPRELERTRITCVTRADDGWSPAVEAALTSFLRQTHPNKELLIVGNAPDGALVERLKRYGERGVRGAAGVEAASGQLLCRWDPGELHDPRRLDIQLRALIQTQASVGLLARRLAWRPATRQLAITADQPQFASLICQPAFWPGKRAGGGPESSALGGARAITLDLPRLSLRVFDGEAFEPVWRDASVRFEGDRCDAVADEVAKRMPLSLAAPRPPPQHKPPRPGEILILTPIKDGRARLPRYMELVSRLDSAGAPLSIAFIEGDSRDGSYDALQDALPSLTGRFDRVEAYQADEGFVFDGPRWAPGLQKRRRAAIARARNRLLETALGKAAWVLWLDVDLIDYPSDLLVRLLAAQKDIVVPHCVLPQGGSFDLNTFIFAPKSGGRDDPADLHEGLFQPPRGKGRLYLEDVVDQQLVRVDSVGGTALLVRGDLHRQGLRFPAESYGGYIETEGLAMMARDRGVGCWALPQLKIVHPNDVQAR